MLPDHRHYYEIIQESRPCHLYFGVFILSASVSHAFLYLHICKQFHPVVSSLTHGSVRHNIRDKHDMCGVNAQSQFATQALC